jgi:hypothetical protein
VLGNERHQVHSPAVPDENEHQTEQNNRHRQRRQRHRASERTESRSVHQSRQAQADQGHGSVGADGYGHINEELIFIERGEQSPHRQDPPSGYEYKGKIEVQNVEKQHRSRSRGSNSLLDSQPVVSISSGGPCPPGWQQVILNTASAAPCPSGATIYTGQMVSSASSGHTNMTGIGGFSTATGTRHFLYKSLFVAHFIA